MLPDAGFPASFLESSWLAPAEELPEASPCPHTWGLGGIPLAQSRSLSLSLSPSCSPLCPCVPLPFPSLWLSFGLCPSGFVFFSPSAFLYLFACSLRLGFPLFLAPCFFCILLSRPLSHPRGLSPSTVSLTRLGGKGLSFSQSPGQLEFPPCPPVRQAPQHSWGEHAGPTAS